MKCNRISEKPVCHVEFAASTKPSGQQNPCSHMKYPYVSKVSADLFALDGKQYLGIVDHYSDYFELEPLTNVAPTTVIKAMKRNFPRYGIPDTCISDNGPQFD